MSLPAFTAHLVPSSQSFVSLPAAVVDDILKHDENAVSLVLRLSWKVDADSHETYVSWCGGIAVEPGSIEIPQEFGICLGISEGIKVKANIPKKKPRRAKTVHVSPLTADDWEVLELHPEELEGQILNQINIVTQKMIIPIWTSNGACIRVRVDELDPVPSAKTPAAKLDNKTEVIVAPRTRERQPEPQASAGEGEVPEPVYEPRLLRVVPHPCELSEQGMQTLEECHGRQHTDSRLQFTALVSGQTAVDCGWPSGILCSLTRCGGAKSEPGCGSRAHSVHQAKEAESAAKSDHDAAGSDHSNNGGLVRQAAHSQVAPLDRATCTGAFLYLQAVNSVHIPYNHIILPVEIRRQLGVPLLTRVKLRPSSRVARLAPPALPTQPLRLHPVRWISGDTSQVGSEAQFEKFDFKTAEEGAPASESTRNSQFPDSAAILSAFADFRASFADTPSEDSTAQMIPALQGSLIKLLVPASNSGNPSSPQALHVLLKFDAALSLLCEPVPIDEDAAEATDVDMALPSAVATITAKDLRWIDTDRCPDPLKVTVGSSIQLRGLGAPGGRGEPGFFAGPTLTDMVGVEDAKASVLRHVSAQLAAAPMRHALGLPPGGGVLIYGQSGTGKSALAAAVANAFRHVNSPQNCVEGPAGSPQAESTAPVYTLHIDCASFVGAKAGPLKRAWRNMLAQAHQNAPSILICDDLDSLVPEGGQDGQQAAARETVALGRFFADLLFPSKASTLRPPGSAVAVIACVKDKGAVTQRLRVPGRLDFEVGLTLPDAAGRKGQIQALLDQLGVATGPPHVDLAALAARTDSFAAADLKRLAKRIAHHAAARYIKHVSPPAEAYTTITEEPQAEAPGCRVEGSKVVVTEADIELAIDGIAPAALQGVKLSSVGSDAKGWADVGGMAKVRSTLREMFELPAKYPELFGTSPIRLRSGVLLYGPSGCGKTMMASVIAKECGMHFISVKGPELLNKYIGASEQSVRQKFSEAKAARPCILFFDEFDSIAPRRGKDNSGVTDRVVNAFLTELDGVEERTGVYVLGATSRPDLIDPALLRPGRLDTMALCDFPDAADRREILDRLCKSLSLAPNATAALDDIALRTEHYSGADLQAIINSAQLTAVHDVIEATKGQSMDANTPPPDVIVTARALRDALAAARPSVSTKDRLFLQGIYQQFGSKLPPPTAERGTKLTMS